MPDKEVMYYGNSNDPDFLVPTEPWARVHARNQKKFNIHLLIGATVFPVSAITLYNSLFWNSTPTFLRDTGIVTKYGAVEAAAVRMTYSRSWMCSWRLQIQPKLMRGCEQ